MFIKTTRLLLVIIASIFFGMCIVWWFMYIAKGEGTLMLKFAMAATVILIAGIISLQLWENKKARREQEKLAREQEKLMQTQEKADKNKV